MTIRGKNGEMPPILKGLNVQTFNFWVYVQLLQSWEMRSKYYPPRIYFRGYSCSIPFGIGL